MKDFKDKVAVVTGAASGIGKAMAERFATEGMKVVLADIERKLLAETEEELKGKGATVLAVPTDVSKAGDVEALAKKTIDAFGAVHLVCNNAGVAVGGVSWERTVADWEWILGVNLWGVIHGIRIFVPIMLEQDSEGYIVNTASLAGLTSIPMHGLYGVTKHGVVTLSETLHHELALIGAKVKISILCPGWVDTRIADADRNRPADLQNDPAEETMRPEEEMFDNVVRQLLTEGLPPEQIADRTFEAIKDEKLYILTHPEMSDAIRNRMEDILAERNPTFDPGALGAGTGEGQ